MSFVCFAPVEKIRAANFRAELLAPSDRDLRRAGYDKDDLAPTHRVLALPSIRKQLDGPSIQSADSSEIVHSPCSSRPSITSKVQVQVDSVELGRFC